MPMRTDRTKRGRIRPSRSELDWFGEDPWGEQDEAMFTDADEAWDLEAFGSVEADVADLALSADDEEEEEDDGYGDWGPVRRRRTRNSE
jgi:hypothetical protein